MKEPVENDNNDIKENQNVLQDYDSERPTEINNNDVRYTEVENDYLFNPIEGFNANSNINIPTNTNENKPEEIKKEENSEVINNNQNNPLFNPNKQIYNLKIIILGDIAVGKTSVINRFISNTFSDSYKTSISCEFQKKELDIDGETGANLQIWDTAGEERFMAVTKQYYIDSHGVMVIYDLTNKETFVKMNKWIKDVKDNAPKDTVIMVIGNKSDLISEKIDLGDELTPFKNEYLYREVSAKNGNNVSLAFEELTQRILEKIKEKKEKEGEDIVKPRDSVPLRKQSKSKTKKKKCHC